jgi:pyruvate/2-oxoglutarate dehydrogenase complex dihydrolipoamide dehydrogenase (E3) component
MIHEIVVAVKTHARIAAIAEAIHAYPTFADGIKMAASDWLEKRA